MKNIYKKPVIEYTAVTEAYGLLLGDSGEVDTEYMESKKSDFEEENETGIPDHYTSIWGDEAEED